MAHNQPTYDFIHGGAASPPRQSHRETFKQSTVKPDINNENLRAQLHTLQYELDSLKQERELTALQQAQEIRDAQNRAEADFKRAQAAETAKNAATKKADTLARDWQDMQDRAANEKAALEKKLRGVQDDNRSLREELEDAQAELLSRDRESKHAFNELEQKHATLQGSVEGMKQDLESRVNALQSTQQKLVQKEAEAGELENEVMKLRAQTGDSDTLAVVKKELSEQVAYIKKLEVGNREQVAELKQFRRNQKSIEVVEEEKHALQAKLRIMDDLRRELSEAQLQKRILEDEKMGWTSYLESEARSEDDMKYETPEQMARAFLQERLERLSLVDKLGSVQPELSAKDEEVQRLQDEKAQMQAEMERLRNAATPAVAPPTGAGDGKALMRLQRQKNLVTKEVEYLRAQMKTFEAEEAEFNPEQVDEERMKRIHDMEDMMQQYRAEVESLRSELSKAEPQQPAPASPMKRAREDDAENEERLAEMRRRARSLQTDIDKLQTHNQFLEAELKASISQIDSLKESSRTRTLELRNNPTAQAEAIKMATLKTLRDENAALLTQLEGKTPKTKVVPVSTLDNMRLQLDEMKATIAQNEKKTLRLKQIWGSKSLEFREAVCSILGWKLDFQPNGRVKASSILYPTSFNDGEEEENSIVFDGEAGTMKVSGGPQSVFAGEIKSMIEYWVEARKEIPCFLAACTLEFYEKSTRAARM
ncbi:coiled-coil domain-containing protein mad1 [Saxophila tyrrhenica]|uniref:Spindle assembly checkpoint component MAD1 n=1 Tax=Saxophila tyrrhenica TaxID=1690608 RepID=A0AAV9P720_9PEZI|nr:coiled-coil domain-containing protein mad1 [Saxophila tyrrhenica]